MARTRMVTRTVNITICEVMAVTVSKAAVSTDTLRLSGIFTDTAVALKECKKLYETDDYKPTAIVNMTTEEVLYGMTEEMFIQMAEILPPRKVYGDTTDSE